MSNVKIGDFVKVRKRDSGMCFIAVVTKVTPRAITARWEKQDRATVGQLTKPATVSGNLVVAGKYIRGDSVDRLRGLLDAEAAG